VNNIIAVSEYLVLLLQAQLPGSFNPGLQGLLEKTPHEISSLTRDNFHKEDKSSDILQTDHCRGHAVHFLDLMSLDVPLAGGVVGERRRVAQRIRDARCHLRDVPHPKDPAVLHPKRVPERPQRRRSPRHNSRKAANIPSRVVTEPTTTSASTIKPTTVRTLRSPRLPGLCLAVRS
jgi:hypothetical protein